MLQRLLLAGLFFLNKTCQNRSLLFLFCLTFDLGPYPLNWLQTSSLNHFPVQHKELLQNPHQAGTSKALTLSH